MSTLKIKSDNICKATISTGIIPPELFNAILQILTILVGMLKNKCNKTPSQVISEYHEPTLFNRLQVRRACIQQMGRHDLRRYQGRVEDAVFEEVRKTNVEEMTLLYQEVK